MVTPFLPPFLTRFLFLTGALILTNINYVEAHAATTINLRVFAEGNLPDEGWLILQTTENDKPLLPDTDREKRGYVARFEEDANKPDYKNTVEVQDPKNVTMSFVQIENTETDSKTHVVECAQYRWLKGYIDDYLSKHNNVTQLDIDVYVNTKYIAGYTPDPGNPNDDIDNSTCNVTFKINGIDFPGK